MKKSWLMLLTMLGLATILIAACSTSRGGSDSASGTTTGSSSNASSSTTVHMNETRFLTETMTIKKGESITLVNDVAVLHIFDNGTWDSNGTPKPAQEPGIPKVQTQVGPSGTQTIGPFTTAGTFHIYCTIHPGMNLTVTVQ
ncbi:MAG: hypothetical protein IMW89_15145 [Ktedonobacteraceae bacterium]|nr:hypothetical protein [Ktedonobacteraceae bacterium]